VVKIKGERQVLAIVGDFDAQHHALRKRECDITWVVNIPRDIEGFFQESEGVRFREEYGGH
jgi:hypothetical protein